VKVRHVVPVLLAFPIVLLISLIILYVLTSGVTVRGTVTDAQNGQPLVGVDIMAANTGTRSDADGHYVLASLPRGSILTVMLDGYQTTEIIAGGNSLFVRDAIVDIALQPRTLEGTVTDAATGRPVAGAVVSMGDRSVVTGEDGAYRLVAPRSDVPLLAHADGFADYRALPGAATMLPIALSLNTVTVTVIDDAEQKAIGHALLHARGQEIQGNGHGEFVLHGLRRDTELLAQADGYLASSLRYNGAPTVTLPLSANVLNGIVRDGYSGEPLQGVAITLKQIDNTRSTYSDQSGRFEFRRLRAGAVLSLSAAGYDTAVITYTDQISLCAALRPNTLRGVVSDGKTGAPIAGAYVSVGDVTVKTARNGEYRLDGIPAGLPLIVNAAGYDRHHQPVGQVTQLDVSLLPSPTVRGIYIPFYLLTVPERVRSLLSFAERAGMNAIVVDIKGDDGYLAYPSAVPLARQIKASYAGSMMPIGDVLALARQHGLYTIARMVVFKDNVLATSRPDLAVKDRRTNGVWDDCGNGSTYWADPFRKEVVDYNVAIAEEAARMGFDEIQFDYIRFPPACTSKTRFENASYAMTSTMETRLAAIETFLAEARRRLKPLGVAIAVDTFGWTLIRDDDLAIGQRMENMAKYVDYICPMVYPSTWEPGALGLAYPPASPYETVYASITYGMNRLKDTNARLRPWLQDFDDYQSRAIPYGIKELDEQRRAAADAGAVGWMLWNAGGSYTEEATP